MVKIGITGGIGSGKSTIAKLWKSLGAYVLNADDLAKQLMVERPEIKSKIIETFGEESYLPDGSLNRTYLAGEAFGRGRVQELNQIVHPYLPGEVKKIMQRAEKEGYPAFVYEAALLLQHSKPDYLDCVVLVLADREQRVSRVMARDDTTREAVADRMEKQQNFQDLRHKADLIIDNDGTLSELKSKAGQYYQVLVESEPDVKR
jgi:dephospho-CoA kinase